MLLGLAALISFTVIEAGYEIVGVWRDMNGARRLASAVDAGNDLALSVKDLAFERGRTNAILHAPAPASEENRNFIRARRASGTAALDRALAVLAYRQRSDDVSGIGTALDELKAAVHAVDELRRQVDDAIAKPLSQRDPKTVEAWFPATTAMLEQVAKTLRVIDTVTDTGHNELAAIAKLRTSALSFRLAAGKQSALLAEAVASQIELPAEKVAEVDRLRGAIEVRESEIVGLSILARNDRVATAVARAMNLYSGEFAAVRRQIYAAATASGAYPMDLAEYGHHSIQALDAVVEIVEVASDAAEKLASAKFESAQREFGIVLLLAAAAIVLMATIAALGIGRFVRPIERVTASLRGRSVAESTELSDINARDDEIGEMSRALAAFEKALHDEQAALAASEERLRFLLSSSPAVIYSRKPHGNFDITYISSNVPRRFGHDAKDSLADPDFWRNNIHPDDIAGVMAGFESLAERGSATIDYRFRNRGGGWRWIRDTVTVVLDPAGKPREIVGAWIDVTSQKESAQALLELNARLEERVAERTASLLESERFNRATLDALGALVAVLDESGNIVATNSAWKAHAFENGARSETVNEGANYLAVCERAVGNGSGDAAAMAAGIKDVIAGQRREFAMEYPCHFRDRKRWFQCRVTRFQHPGASRLVIAHEDVTPVHRALDKLATSERTFAAFADVSPVGIFRTDAEGRCQYVNARWTKIAGMPRDEAMGDGWLAAVHEDDRAHVLDQWSAATQAGLPFRAEYRFKDSAGWITWVIGQSQEIRHPDGTVAGFIGAITDVTELKEIGSKLMESEARFRGIVEHLPLAVVVKSPDRRFIKANPVWERMYGVPEAKILGKTTSDVFPGRLHNDDTDRWDREVLESRQVRVRSIWEILPDGKRHDLVVTKFPIFDATGNVAMIGGFIRDVTDQLQTMHALKESEARFRGIIEHLPLAIVVKSLDSRFVAANPAWEEMYGLSEGQILGKTTPDIFPGRPQNDDVDRQERDIVETHEIRARSVSLILPDGKRHDLVVTKFPIFDATGNVAMIGGFIRDVTDQLLSVRALQENEARLRGIIDNLPISLDVRDRESRYVLLSRICSEWYGISESSAVGKTNAELFPDRPISNAISATGDHEVIETRRRNVRESERTLSDGKKHLLEIVKFPIFDPTGEIASIGTFVSDVTERRLTERALRLISTTLATVSAQEFFDTLVRLISTLLDVEKAIVGEIVDDTKSRIRTKAVFENCGLGEPFEYGVAGTPSAGVIADGQSVYVENAKDTFSESPYLSKHGIASYAAVALRDAGGEVIGHIAVMSTRPFENPELTKSILELFATRASAELQRVRLEARFRDLFEYSPDGLIMTGGDGKIVRINRAAETMFGYSRDEIVGSPVEMLIPEEFRPGHVDLRRRYVATPVPRKMTANRLDLKARRKDGSIFPADIDLSPIRVGDGISVVASVRDISDKVAVERQLLHAQKMEAIGAMTGGLAHDFNNLLAVIITNLELISQRAPSDAVTTRMIARAVEASERSGQLVQRLLAFSRKQVLNSEVIDLNALILRVRELVVRPLGAEIEIGLAIREDLWLCRADAAQVEAAIVNLAINARDAMPDGGILTIESDNVVLDRNSPMIGATARPGEYATLSVSDTGTGMAPDVLDRCIEPFFTTKDVGKGSGLGLSMVFGLANQSGGYLDIVSRPGHGTTVRIYFPRVLDKDAAAKAPPDTTAGSASATAHAGNNRRIHILVVEDDADMRAASVTAVESCGYRATATEDGPSALSALDANPDVRVLFSDVILPGGMNGVRLAEEAVRRRPGLRVLLTSGYTGDALAGKDMPNSSWQMLKKPYRLADLRKMLIRIAEDEQIH